MRLLTADVVARSNRAARVKERASTTRANTARACKSSSGSDCFPMGNNLSRFAAASLALVMLGAVALAHVHAGFFMNWAGTQQGEGFEYHLLAIALALVVVVAGAGRASIDRKLTMRRG